MHPISSAALMLLIGAVIGVPLGYALSQAAPQVRVQVLLQHRVTDISLPANLEVRDDRWDPGAETGLHDHTGPVILAIIEGELIRTPRAAATLCAPARWSGVPPTGATMSRT